MLPIYGGINYWPKTIHYSLEMVKSSRSHKFYMVKFPFLLQVLYSTARVMEVSLESSFQPTVQLYLMLPQLIDSALTKVHYTTVLSLRYTTVKYSALTKVHYTSKWCTALHCIALHYTALH